MAISESPDGLEDWFQLCQSVRSVNISTQYFLDPESDPNLWIRSTTEYFNYLGLTLEEARIFLDNWLRKARECKKKDGVNGSSWEDSLSEQEDTLAKLLHFKNYYTNYGIELYVTTCQKNLI